MGITIVSWRCVSNRRARAAVLSASFALAAPYFALRRQVSQTPGPAKTPPVVGTIKTISGNNITLATDAGAEIKILVLPDARLLRVAPGSKDLKEATPIQLSDLQAGDRILVRGTRGENPATLTAISVVAMKKAEIADKQAREREEWQKHGTGGLVRSIDQAAGVITIATMTATGSKDVAVHLSKSTSIRRYAPGSVKFDDAKPGTLAELKPGDQLRTRGTRSPDGLDFTADEIVSGSFRNIAGTIVSLDAKAGTLTVMDLMLQKNVEVILTSDSQLRKLPQPMAQRIAMRLKGDTPAAPAQPGAAKSGDAPATPPGANGQGTGGGPNGATGGAARSGGGDLQQMLGRLPASPLSDFQKGDAVMIVATDASQDSHATAITLLGGVEPILQASPRGQVSSILTPWTLNGGGGMDAGTP